MPTTIEHRTDLFKVIRTDQGGFKSALLTVSKNSVNYGQPNGQVFIAPPKNGTPFLAFSDVAQAQAFVAKHGGSRSVYRLEVYGVVVPVDTVLQVKYIGWDDQLAAFWEAVRYGRPLDDFHTVSCPEGTVAIFGPVRLLEQIGLPPRPFVAPRW